MPSPTAPYPNLEDVVTTARVRVNDAIVQAGGQTLTDAANFTIYYVNAGYQKMQQFLVSQGYETLEDETQLTLPAVSSIDQAVQVSLSWTGYNNGGGLSTAAVLPQNLIRPKVLLERVSGSGQEFIEMTEILSGLPRTTKEDWNKIWEWRADAIWMPGAKTNTDVVVRYSKYLADFVPNATTPFADQTVPIMRSKSALAWFIGYEFSWPRGDLEAATMLANAKEEAMQILGGDSEQGHEVQKVSERSKMHDRFTGGQGVLS